MQSFSECRGRSRRRHSPQKIKRLRKENNKSVIEQCRDAWRDRIHACWICPACGRRSDKRSARGREHVRCSTCGKMVELIITTLAARRFPIEPTLDVEAADVHT